MKENVKNGNEVTPMLFPYDPVEYWEQIRKIVREEVKNAEKEKPASPPTLQTPGLTYKPLFKIAEVCALFHVSKPTIRLGETWKTETLQDQVAGLFPVAGYTTIVATPAEFLR